MAFGKNLCNDELFSKIIVTILIRRYFVDCLTDDVAIRSRRARARSKTNKTIVYYFQKLLQYSMCNEWIRQKLTEGGERYKIKTKNPKRVLHNFLRSLQTFL